MGVYIQKRDGRPRSFGGGRFYEEQKSHSAAAVRVRRDHPGLRPLRAVLQLVLSAQQHLHGGLHRRGPDHQPLLSHLPHRRHGHRAEYPPVLSGGAPAGGAAAGLVPVRHERGVADDRRFGGNIHLPAHGAPAGVHLRRGDAGGVHGADAVGGGHHRGHGAGGPAFEVQAPRAVHRAAVPEHRRGGYFPVRSDLPQLQ